MIAQRFLSRNAQSKISQAFRSLPLLRAFSITSTLDLPVVNTENFQTNLAECKKAVECFEKYGVMIVKDPRVNHQANSDFIDQMESYFTRESQKFYRGEKLDDIRPEAGMNIGVVPEGYERARNHKLTIDQQFSSDRPTTMQPPPLDKKWRFTYRVGEDKMVGTGILGENVIPEGLPQFAQVMDNWGNHMRNSVFSVAEMLARGYELPANYFTRRMEGASQLLAPTGSDLARYGEAGTVLAGFHYDLSFISIHGKSRFPGLYIWLRDGRKVQVKVPEGCLLLQAAKQMEILTGGQIFAGFHEVIVTEETVKAVEKAKKEGKSTWRVSSTMFSSVGYNEMLEPSDIFATPDALIKYPAVRAYDQVADELRAIGLLVE